MELNFPFLASITTSRPSLNLTSYFCTQEGLKGNKKRNLEYIKCIECEQQNNTKN